MVASGLADQDFYRRMVEMIERRYQATAHKSIRDVYALDTDFLNTENDVVFAIHNRSRILSLLAQPQCFSDLVQVFLNNTIAFTYASNQFVQLNAGEEAELRRIYTGYLRDLQDLLLTSQTEAGIVRGLHARVALHFSDLRTYITRFFDPETSGKEDANVIFHQPICAEYSPALQMEIFGLRLSDLIPPVLDIGCGKSGKLVCYLDENGINAVGVDRWVKDSPNLIQADWLDFPLEPEGWGTVLSHMSFSNHFIFQDRYKHGQIHAYARQYMAVLKALRPGGSFYYTPALPFIETYLPKERYQITCRQIIGDLSACRVLRIR